MQSRTPRPYAARRVLVAAAAAVLALSACGTATSPQPGQTSSGGPSAPLRPVTDQPTEADGGLQCPASLDSAEGMTVPQKPQGVDGAARLLPNRQADSLVDCTYPVLDVDSGPLKAPFALEKRTVASAEQRKDVVDLLTWAPLDNLRSKPCTAMGGDETVHLVGSRYPDAIVWVAAKADPNGCSKSTNGDFVSPAPVGSRLEMMFGDRARPDPAPTGPCASWGFGRLGDHRSLVPDGDPAVTVCRNRVDGTEQAIQLSAEQSREVVAALRGLTVGVSESGCSNSGDDYSRQFRLVLTYPQGPAVWVNASPTCTPQLYSSGLAAVDAGSVIDLVEQWSPPIPGPDPDAPVSNALTGP